MTEAVPEPVKVNSVQLASRKEAGRLLLEWVEGAGLERPESDAGLWTWLSLLLFDSTCPVDGNGMRKPGKYNRHIAEVDNWQKRHRHLLLSPFLVYRAHRDQPDRACVLLCQQVHKPGDIVTQITERQEYWSNRGVIEAAGALYIDPATGKQRVGAQNKSKGGVRRFADVLNQLDLNWYLYGMSAQELIEYLPEKEFSRFLTKA
ncbi:MAG: hypothetical protein KDK74_14750 [Cephaloticoccus sp.]|nr:hypothetical protein [Cephaloticoccus sp.]